MKARRLFSLALLAYPRAFRRRFGDEMHDDFRRRPLARPARVRTLGTLAINGLAERGSAVVALGVVLERHSTLVRADREALHVLDTLRADVRHTIRLAVKTPVFTTLTILALALGIGATTAIFAVINGVLLRALPYRDDARLVNVWSYNTTENRPRNPLSPANFLDFQRMNTTLDGLEGYFAIRDAGAAADRQRHREWPIRCSSRRICSTCSAAPRRSAARSPPAKRAPVVVLSDGYWRRRFGADPGIVGKHADALRHALPGDRRDAARLRVPLSRHARAERIHARHQHRHVAADRLLRPDGRREPDADAAAGRSCATLTGGARSAALKPGVPPQQVDADMKTNRRAARAGVPGHEQGLERNRRALDRSIGRQRSVRR